MLDRLKRRSDKPEKTCIRVRYRQHKLRALIDTGSDVNIAGQDVARKMGWPIYTHHTKEVSVANNETMVISGVAQVLLRVGRRQIETEILVSPDFEGLILGYTWLHRQGSFEWDFPRERIRLGKGNWVSMQEDEPLVKVRRIVATQDIIIPARGQATATAHMLHNAWSCMSEPSQYGVMESQPVTTVEHVYSGRVLLPMSMAAPQVPVLNGRELEIVLRKGTLLGKVFAARSEAVPTATGSRVNRIQTEGGLSLTYKEVIGKMVDDLPSDLTDEQRGKVRELLIWNRTILSTGDHDVGRTPLVEHTIDTGDHRPIRQPLRRQPFQHQAYIDEETNRMLEYGIIEPAASPLASNVVLVKKKDGSLRF